MFKITFTLALILFGTSFSVSYAEETAPSINLDSAEIQFPRFEEMMGRNFVTSATIYLSSNYIFRGITQTKNRPATQGSYNLTHTSGVTFGGFVSNVDLDTVAPEVTKTEGDIYLAYNGEVGSVSWGVMALQYTYLENSKLNYSEYAVFARSGFFKVDAAYAPEYGGVKSSATYLRLSATARLNKTDLLVFSAGQTSFSDKNLIGFKNYTDYKMALTHTAAEFTAEFAYTDTDRQDLTGSALSDRALTFSISRTF